MPGLVHHLVDRLVRLVGAQQHRVGARIAAGGLRVAGTVRGAAGLGPVRLGRIDRACRVVEGPQHAGDVPHRGLRHAPLGQRPGRLALEVDQLPLAGRRAQTLTEVQIAVHPLRGPGAALGGQVAERRERRPQPVRVRPQRGHRLDGRLQPLGHAVDHEPELHVTERDRRQRPGQRGVHLGGRPPQGPRLGAEVLALGQLAQRQLPAVGGALHERLEHPQDVRLVGVVRRGRGEDRVRGGRDVGDHPGRRRGHPGAALAGQRQREFQVRIDPGHYPAQKLQDERISVDDRRVGLFRGHHARHQPGPDVLAEVPLEAQPADAGLGAQRLQEQLGGPGVVQGVVDRPAGQRSRRHMSDERGRQPRRQRLAHAYQQLVAVAGVVGCPVGRHERLVRADEQVVQAQLAGAREQLGGLDQGEPGDRAPLAGEPALPRQPFPQQRIQGCEKAGRGGDGACDGFRHGVASFHPFLVRLRRLQPVPAGAPPAHAGGRGVTDACPGRGRGNAPPRGFAACPAHQASAGRSRPHTASLRSRNQ